MTAYTPLPTTSNPPSASVGGKFNWSSWSANTAAFAAANSANAHPGRPSFLQAATARPLRLGLYCLGAFVTLLVIAGSTGRGPATGPVRKIGSYASESLEGWTFTSGGSWRELPQNEGLLDPTFVKGKDGNRYPPDVYPSALNPFKRANAALVSLVRNGEKDSMRDSMRHVEERFNRKFGYPWVFMNDEPFTEDFKRGVRAMTRSEVYFDVIPREHWGYPDYINQTIAAEERQKMEDENVIYGGSESYRHMCRFNSGFFFKSKSLLSFDYYWRVEPGVEFFCDIDYDPFLFMQENNKVYSFTIALYEYERTIQTLWQTVRDFAKLHPEHIAKDNSINFLVDDKSEGLDARYNLCHFWSNFEIADMRFWRSKAYQDFFEYLDATGGFFYERWGDAPVHSIAAALFVPSEQIHQFNDIAYRHNPYTHCPQDGSLFDSGKCNCNPKDSFDLDGYSCMRQWWRVGPNPN
ncbi:glycosyl transferase [Meredithblackwellia eburnea MCA 4105]